MNELAAVLAGCRPTGQLVQDGFEAEEEKHIWRLSKSVQITRRGSLAASPESPFGHPGRAPWAPY